MAASATTQHNSVGSAATITVAAADGILRCDAFATAHRPDTVLHLGGRWASKVLGGGLTADPATRHVVGDPCGRGGDPDRAAPG
ncbi:MAG TPA: hypothetical protein VM030_11045, partial [Acidimicrobiales bacterium]|nr:hypothetical protein [Acidimicrobiales bacterium]